MIDKPTEMARPDIVNPLYRSTWIGNDIFAMRYVEVSVAHLSEYGFDDRGSVGFPALCIISVTGAGLHGRLTYIYSDLDFMA